MPNSHRPALRDARTNCHLSATQLECGKNFLIMFSKLSACGRLGSGRIAAIDWLGLDLSVSILNMFSFQINCRRLSQFVENPIHTVDADATKQFFRIGSGRVNFFLYNFPCFLLRHAVYVDYLYSTPWVKKQDTKHLPITFPNVNRFSKFFHCQTQRQICNKIIF